MSLLDLIIIAGCCGLAYVLAAVAVELRSDKSDREFFEAIAEMMDRRNQ